MIEKWGMQHSFYPTLLPSSRTTFFRAAAAHNVRLFEFPIQSLILKIIGFHYLLNIWFNEYSDNTKLNVVVYIISTYLRINRQTQLHEKKLYIHSFLICETTWWAHDEDQIWELIRQNKNDIINYIFIRIFISFLLI